MTVVLPSEWEAFVDRLVADRRFSSRQEVVVESLRLLKSHETLQADVQAGFAQLDAGQRIPASEVFAEAERMIERYERGQTGGTP